MGGYVFDVLVYDFLIKLRCECGDGVFGVCLVLVIVFVLCCGCCGDVFFGEYFCFEVVVYVFLSWVIEGELEDVLVDVIYDYLCGFWVW